MTSAPGPAPTGEVRDSGGFYPHGRRDFAIPEGVVWLDTAHQGAMPRRAAEAAERALAWKLDPSGLPESEFFEAPERLRSLLARLIGVSPEDVVIGNSASHGLMLLADGLDLGAGDEILLVRDDFPATVLPWLPLRRKGVVVRHLPRRADVTPTTVDEAMTPRTRVLCVTWVDSFSGHVLDLPALGRICQAHGVLLIVNATQGLGARTLGPARVGAHAVTCSGYKWLCGPYGTGFCWIREDLRSRLRPWRRYWLPEARARGLDGLADLSRRPPHATVRRFDVCCPASFNNVLPWIEALEYLSEVGPARIAAHNRLLVDALRRIASEAGHEPLSGAGLESPPFLVFSPGDGRAADRWVERLAGAGIHVSLREGRVRVSPHIHNDMEDVERFRRALRE